METHSHDESGTTKDSKEIQPTAVTEESKPKKKPAQDSLGDAMSKEATTDATVGPKVVGTW